MASGGGTKATVAALIGNSAIAVSKFVAFGFTGSAALLAEAIHSVADTGNQGLLLFGMKSARRKPTPSHPFGYGRERYFWAFIVAVVLFTLGSLFSLFEGYEKLRHPHEIESSAWAIGVLLAAIVFETFSLSVAVRESNAVRTGSWTHFIRHSKIPELPVVLLEDLGAMFGLVVALAGVTASAVTGNPSFDALGSMVIGVLLGIIAIILAVEMKSLLIGESATPADLETIVKTIEADPDVQRVIHIRTQHLGPEELLVGAKVRMADNLKAAGVVDAINRVEAKVREAVPAARVMYVEPDLAAAAGSTT